MEIKKIKPKNPPKFKKITMLCDTPIDDKLKDIDVIKDFFNQQNTTVILGKQGQGKTSILMNFVKIYKKCFHHIYVFMRETSRLSIKDNIFDEKLPQEQLFEDLTVENIKTVYNKVKEHSMKDEFSWLIFDDVQDALKDVKVVKEFNILVANQRHLRTVNFILLQNFYALDNKIRQLVNNVFLFNVGKQQIENIFIDYINKIKKDDFEKICNSIFVNDHSWVFVNLNSMRIYNDEFEELVISVKDKI